MSDEIIDDALNEVANQELNKNNDFIRACSNLAQNICGGINTDEGARLQDAFNKMLVSTNEAINSSTERASSKSSRKPKHVKFQQESSDDEEEEEWEDTKEEPEPDEDPDNDGDVMNEYDTEWSAFHRTVKAHLILIESFSLLLKKYRN